MAAKRKRGGRRNTSAARREKRATRPCLLLIDGENVRGTPQLKWRVGREELSARVFSYLRKKGLYGSQAVLLFDGKNTKGKHVSPTAERAEDGYIVVSSGSELKADDIIIDHIPRLTSLNEIVLVVVSSDETLLRRCIRAVGGSSSPQTHRISSISASNYTRHLNIIYSADFVRLLTAENHGMIGDGGEAAMTEDGTVFGSDSGKAIYDSYLAAPESRLEMFLPDGHRKLLPTISLLEPIGDDPKRHKISEPSRSSFPHQLLVKKGSLRAHSSLRTKGEGEDREAESEDNYKESAPAYYARTLRHVTDRYLTWFQEDQGARGKDGDLRSDAVATSSRHDEQGCVVAEDSHLF